MKEKIYYFDAMIWPFCSKDCLFCCEWGRGKRSIISLKKFKEIYTTKFIQHVVFTWWEPFLNSQLIEYINYAKKQWSKVSVVSAWIKNISEEFLWNLLETGLDEIMLSIEWTEFIHDLLVQQKWAFKDAIDLLVRLWKLERGGTKIIINTNINKINYKYLPDFISYILKTFPFIFLYHIQWLDPDGNAKKNSKILFESYEKLLKPFLNKEIFFIEKIKFWRVPHCVFPLEKRSLLTNTHYEILSNYWDNIYINKYYMEDKYISDVCKSCKEFKNCELFFNRYIEMFWDSEINPL